ncbi:MAG: hypothetical protein WCF18_21930 [Chthoniobacteraceae bacterium]
MRKTATLAAATVLLCSAVADACSIPVFRYALDRWTPDRFTLEVAPGDVSDEKVAHFLRNFTDNSPLNLRIERLPEDSTEHSRLRPPGAAEDAWQLWSGKLDGAVIKSLSDSPARKEIVRRILAGDSMVWVLVTAGKSDADAAIAARLDKRLRYLEQIAQIPPIDPNDPSSQLGPGPALGVKFSMLQINADSAAEKPFLAMLAGAKADEMGNHGTWLAAVFGRGRVLGAWGARDFGDEQIDEVSLFLLGACSCQVKRQNPGWDLLLDVDWDGKLQELGVPAIATTTSPSVLAGGENSAAPSGEPAPATAVPPEVRPPAAAPSPAMETVTITSKEPASSPAGKAPGRTDPRPLTGAAGALLALGAGLTWWSMRKRL